ACAASRQNPLKPPRRWPDSRNEVGWVEGGLLYFGEVVLRVSIENQLKIVRSHCLLEDGFLWAARWAEGGRTQPSPYCLILLRIVRLLIPSSSAALVRLPFHFSSARTMVSRSMSFIDIVAVDPSGVPAAVVCLQPAEASRTPAKGLTLLRSRSDTSISWSSQRIMARSRMFCSSRMLPGNG